MMALGISSFRVMERFVAKFNATEAAKFTVHYSHFRFSGVRLMEDADGTFKIWPPSKVRFNAGFRQDVLELAVKKYRRAVSDE